MRVMLRCDQDRIYIDKADEIYIPWKRRDLIEEIHTQYPKKTVVLDVVGEDVEDNDLMLWMGMCNGNFKIITLLDKYEHIPLLKRVLNYPMRTLYEMQVAYDHGIREFYLGTELIHQLDKVKGFKTKTKSEIRCKVNLAAFGWENYMTENNTIIGSYILPQEIPLIADVVDTVDFAADTAVQENGYYNIYLNEGYWGGELGMLIKDIDSKAAVRMMDANPIRFRCNLACLTGGSCRFCYHNLSLANPELYKEMSEDIEKDKD